jgi:splicing factor 3A subunit 3
VKETKEYKKYVKDLGIYMETFIAKTRPLLDLDERKEEILKKFKNTYSKEVDKEFYCKFCQKEFQKETVYASHLKGKKHLKNLKNPDILKEKEDEEREVKMWEFLVQEYTQELHNVIEETVFHVERKQTLTEKEYMEEAMDEPVVLSDVESDDSEALYNPLKLPMGWDGKPIPYWLYKLHGLGVEYKCEICGNFVYMGRKAFEGHFSAFRHIYGLRCLGITNTRHFSEITSIQDALDCKFIYN